MYKFNVNSLCPFDSFDWCSIDIGLIPKKKNHGGMSNLSKVYKFASTQFNLPVVAAHNICSVVLSMGDGTQHEIQLMGGGRGKIGPRTLDMVNGYRLWNLRLQEAESGGELNWKEEEEISKKWQEFTKSLKNSLLWQRFELQFPNVIEKMPLGDSEGSKRKEFFELLSKKFPDLDEWLKKAKSSKPPSLNSETAKTFLKQRMDKFDDRWPVNSDGSVSRAAVGQFLNYCGIGGDQSDFLKSSAADIIRGAFEKGPSGDEWEKARDELDKETGKMGHKLSDVTKRAFELRHGKKDAHTQNRPTHLTQSTSRSLSDIAKDAKEKKSPVQHTKSWITLEDFDDPKVILRGGRLIRLEKRPEFGNRGEEGHVIVRGTTVEQRERYDRIKLVKKAFNDKVASDNHYSGKGFHVANKLDGLPGFREKLEKLGIEHYDAHYNLLGDAYEKKRQEYFINLGKNAHRFPEEWAIRRERDLKAKADDMKRRREEDAKNKLGVHDQLRKVSEDLENYGLQPRLSGESHRDHVVRLNNIHHSSVVFHDNEILNNTKAVPNQHPDNPISRKEWIEKNKETLKQQSERLGVVKVKPVNEQAKKALGWKTKRDVDNIRNGKRLWGMVERGYGDKHPNAGMDCRDYFRKWAAEFKPALKPPDHPEDYLEPGIGFGESPNQEAWDKFFLALHKTPNSEKLVKNVVDLKYGTTQLPVDREAKGEQKEQRKARAAQENIKAGQLAGEEADKRRINSPQPPPKKDEPGSELAGLGDHHTVHSSGNQPVQNRPGDTQQHQHIDPKQHAAAINDGLTELERIRKRSEQLDVKQRKPWTRKVVDVTPPQKNQPAPISFKKIMSYSQTSGVSTSTPSIFTKHYEDNKKVYEDLSKGSSSNIRTGGFSGAAPKMMVIDNRAEQDKMIRNVAIVVGLTAVAGALFYKWYQYRKARNERITREEAEKKAEEIKKMEEQKNDAIKNDGKKIKESASASSSPRGFLTKSNKCKAVFVYQEVIKSEASGR